MKINFDSNVWRIVANPDAPEYSAEPSLKDFRKIRQAIIDKAIEPLLTETMFTLEAIKKKDRKDFFSDYEPNIDIKEGVTSDGMLSLQITIGPDKTAHPGNTSQLAEYLAYATGLGFKILKFPRIGGLVNNDIEKHYFQQEGEELTKYLDKVNKVGREIEKSGAGIAFIKNIGLKYHPSEWKEGIKLSPDSEINPIAKAFAEWADGDSIASHIAFGGDYFCTRDSAGGAGSKSVFSVINQTWLSDHYGLKTITPENLAALL
jgi:hypothetical protein